MDVSIVPSVAALLMLIGMGGGLGFPLGVPPLPEDPVLAQVAPEQCLFYSSWAGTAAPDPASDNPTEQLLAEPEVQQLIAQVRQLVKKGVRKAAEEKGGDEFAGVAEDVVRWAEKLLTSPTAVYVSKVEIRPNGPDVRAGAVVRVGDDAAQLKAALERLQQRFIPDAVQAVEEGGDTWYRIQPPNPGAPVIAWGVKGRYFILGIGEGEIEGMKERARTEPPAWLAQIARQLPVERRSTVTYLDVKAVRDLFLPLADDPMVARVVDALGLGNVTSLVSVTGLDKPGFVSRALVGLEGEPQGLFRLAYGKPLAAEDLAPIPSDATIALAARIDPEQVLETILSVAGKIDPHARDDVEEGIGEMEEALGFNLRRDVLAALGDTCRLYNSPGEGGLVITGLTAVVDVKDRQRLAATHAKFLAVAKAEMERRRRGPRIEQFEFAGHDVFTFNARDDDFPLAPSWCLTDDALVIAPFPQNVKAYLARGEDHEPITAVPEVAGLVEPASGPVLLAYVDAKSVFETAYPLVLMVAQAAMADLGREMGIDLSVSMLPSAKAIGSHLGPSVAALRRTEAGIEITSMQTLPGGNPAASAPIAVALALPAVQSARGAARSVQSMNNMKQIALALHNYHDVYKSFPPAYTTDENGKPLLSWRVQILPFIEQAPLYQQFHLDEPWDSEHNKRLIARMPPEFRSPQSKAAPGMTNYLGVGGEAGVFPGRQKIAIRDIRDGTSNTIMVVEANDPSAVIWTKPEDFVPDPDSPVKGLIGLRRDGFLAGMCDGSVRLIGKEADRDLLRALFTRSGGEAVDFQRLDRPR
jgi:hypothetical protein